MRQTSLYPFQKLGVERIQWSGGRHILADEMSLGKTLQSLYWGWRFLPDTPPGPTVAVVPAHLKENWAKEASRHLGVYVEVLGGRRVPHTKQKPLDPNQVYAVNYDVLVPPKWNPKYALPEDSWAHWLAALKPRYVIGDESQKLKDPETKWSRAFRRMCRGVPHVVLLTGTPVTNSPMDLWSLLNVVRPDLYPSRWEFGHRFTNARRRWWGWEFPGARDLDLLHHELVNVHGVMTRRRKVDVAGDLPPFTLTVVPLDVDLREYRRAEADFLAWLARKDAAAALRAAQAEALNRVNYLRRLAGELKVPAVIDWVKDFFDSGGGRLLLGAVHKRVTAPLVDAFRGRAVLVDGELTAAEKVRRIDAFNSGSSPFDLMVGNISSAGTGWNCTCTSDAAVAEPPWTPADLAQFWGRVYGMNRGLPGVPAHGRVFVAKGTVDEDVCEILTRKQAYSDQAIDGGAPGNGADIFDLVLSAMKRRAGRAE